MKKKKARNLYIECQFMRLLFERIPDKRIWKRTFQTYFRDPEYGYSLKYERMIQNKKWLLQGFVSTNLKLVKKSGIKNSSGNSRFNPILISVVKNEIEKLPLFFEHYRKLGIKKFAIIDNMSDDGSLEFLKQQKDAEVYLVKDEFRGFLKEGWINRVMAQYGFNRWYLVADADELLVWPGMEELSLSKMIQKFNKRKLFRPLTIMVDMYPQGELYKNPSKDILNECRYFDKDTYYWLDNQKVDILSGGPRKRVFQREVWLSKTPLFYLRPKELLCCAHYMYPYYKSRKQECPLALLHYKFAYKDSYKRMKEYIRNGIDTDRIMEIKACSGKMRVSFYNEKSECLNEIKRLCEIPNVTDVF